MCPIPQTRPPLLRWCNDALLLPPPPPRRLFETLIIGLRSKAPELFFSYCCCCCDTLHHGWGQERWCHTGSPASLPLTASHSTPRYFDWSGSKSGSLYSMRCFSSTESSSGARLWKYITKHFSHNRHHKQKNKCSMCFMGCAIFLQISDLIIEDE